MAACRDRVSRAADGPLTGEVVDFIAVDWFAIFNLADVFTTCVIAGWTLTTLLTRRTSNDLNTRRGETVPAPTPNQEQHR